jgi:hypothetical protein
LWSVATKDSAWWLLSVWNGLRVQICFLVLCRNVVVLGGRYPSTKIVSEDASWIQVARPIPYSYSIRAISCLEALRVTNSQQRNHNERSTFHRRCDRVRSFPRIAAMVTSTTLTA